MSARGFTLIEVVMAVALFSGIALLALPFLSTDVSRADAGRVAEGIADALREQQFAVMAGAGDARRGVHLQENAYVLFDGATYVPADPDNVTRDLPADVRITDVSLSPGGACALPAGTGNCDVLFVSRKGMPAQSGTITVTGADGNPRTVDVNEAGMINANANE